MYSLVINLKGYTANSVSHMTTGADLFYLNRLTGVSRDQGYSCQKVNSAIAKNLVG